MARRKLLTTQEAVVTAKQHTTPCSDCPFLRTALPGWLGGHTANEFIRGAHSEVIMDCHTRKQPERLVVGTDEDPLELAYEDDHHWQCAGVATYRANVCKQTLSPEILKGKADRKTVFAFAQEFAEHHGQKLEPLGPRQL